jgi:hypothetical protein
MVKISVNKGLNTCKIERIRFTFVVIINASLFATSGKFATTIQRYKDCSFYQ